MKILEKILQFCLPTSCVFCDKEDNSSRYIGICKSCNRREFYHTEFPSTNRCGICYHPLQDGSCNFCDTRNVFVDGSLVLRPKREKERRLMNHLKFEKERILGRFFSMGLGNIIPTIKNWNPDFIVPIPSHSSTWKERPFYPTEILLKRITQKTGVQSLDCLEKISSTKQSSLNRQDRFLHAKTAFRIKKKCLPIPPNTILLVDDVYTTGSSTNEVACLLKSVGVQKVYQLVILRPEEGVEI